MTDRTPKGSRIPGIPEEPETSEMHSHPLPPSPAILPSFRRTSSSVVSLYLEERRPSVVLPHLEDKGKKFFELVANGNVQIVQQFLRENHGFNINCTNFQGLSALHIALQSHSEAMVAFLLAQPNIDVGDCALHAVKENQLHMLEMILDKLQQISPGLESAGCTRSSDFPGHITPLILAAQCGHYEIIELLIHRGHSIRAPHPPDCSCHQCITQAKTDDPLNAAAERFNIYQAICNPAYICHSSVDPILTAFRLSRELRARAVVEPEFRAAYNQLDGDISAFAVELIGLCRSTDEVELVLQQPSSNGSSGYSGYPRLILAMDWKQKEFVAHPNTQQVLTALWLGGWREWITRPWPLKIFSVVPRLAIMPFMLIMCIFVPNHIFVQHWNAPVNKLISHMASYLFFLALIFVESYLDKTHQKRGPPQSGLEPVIIIYVFGYIWSCVRMCIFHGPRRYFRILFNWHDCVMLFLFMSTFMFWMAAFIEVEANDQRDLERKYWHYLDPTLIAEGLFSVATIMAYFRLLFLCQLSYTLGPLQISLGKMGADIGKFIVIFAVLILSFTAGLSRLYQYYDGMIQTDPVSGTQTVQVSSFVSFRATFKTLFWALFCMSPLESADVVIENLPGERSNTTIINNHGFTELVGHLAFACFEVLSVVVILNMLIATMSNTFQRVTDNVDVEWTFGRTEIYMDYMAQTTLPSPFNLIPTTRGIASVIEYMRVLFRPIDGKSAHFSLTHCCYIDQAPDEKLEKNFSVLISQLIQRYFREKDKSNDVGSSEMEAVRIEIAELKAYIAELTNRRS